VVISLDEPGQQISESTNITAWTYLQEQAQEPPATGKQRSFARYPCNGCLPLQLRLLDAAAEPCSDWHQADPLDFSLGGCCLMLPIGDSLALDHAVPLELALPAEAGFEQTLLKATLRWFVQSGLVIILGIAYDEPLGELPQRPFGSA